MKPGSELDFLIEDRIFSARFPAAGEVPKYSTDIAAAWRIMEKFKWAEPEVRYSDEQHCWSCTFLKGQNSGIGHCGETAPHAICLAALEAVKEKK